MLTDYEKNQKRTDANITYRTFEDNQYIKVSKTTKARLNITIHPYLKDEFKKYCENDLNNTSVAEELEKYIRNVIESKLGKKIILKQ